MDKLHIWWRRKLKRCKHKSEWRHNMLITMSIYHSGVSLSEGMHIKIVHCTLCNQLFLKTEGSIDAILNQPDE